MPTKVFLKPNPAQKIDGKPVRVFDPAHRDFLPESGRFVFLNIYWINRLRYGEVLCVTDEKAAAPAPAPQPTEDEMVNNFKSKKDVISFAREKFGDDFADSLDEKAKLDELKSAVINELNKH